MLRTDLPEIITETLPGPKAKEVIERRKNAVPSPYNALSHSFSRCI